MEPWGGINLPPSKPKIVGPASGKEGEEYDFTISTIDPDEDEIFFWIDWGDGNIEDWIGPYNSSEEVNISHTWSKKGNYIIKAKARDIYFQESDFVEFSITIPRDRMQISSFLLNFFNKSPPIQRLIRILLWYF